MEYDIDPKSLKDARINEVFVESESRILLHLRDGRAVAIESGPTDFDGGTDLSFELVNP